LLFYSFLPLQSSCQPARQWAYIVVFSSFERGYHIRSFSDLVTQVFCCCCAGWGYIVALTKVLTIYQIYHTWIQHRSFEKLFA
jgi:hypothetical protein